MKSRPLAYYCIKPTEKKIEQLEDEIWEKMNELRLERRALARYRREIADVYQCLQKAKQPPTETEED